MYIRNLSKANDLLLSWNLWIFCATYVLWKNKHGTSAFRLEPTHQNVDRIMRKCCLYSGRIHCQWLTNKLDKMKFFMNETNFGVMYVKVKRARTHTHTLTPLCVLAKVWKERRQSTNEKKNTHFNEKKKVKRLLKVCKCTKAPNKYYEREVAERAVSRGSTQNAKCEFSANTRYFYCERNINPYKSI